jgi:hypothetical protein
VKNGEGHGEFIWRSVDDAVDLIEGTRRRTDFALDGVRGSRTIGLKKIISVLRESGDEQSLGVSDDELSWFVSDSAGFELVDVEVGVLDPELLAIFDRKVMPRLKILFADLKILLYLLDAEESLLFTDELPAATTSLKRAPLRKRK